MAKTNWAVTSTCVWMLMIFFILNVIQFTSSEVHLISKRQSRRTPCTTSEGIRGTCVPFRQCKTDDLPGYNRRIKPKECGMDINGPVICCPQRTALPVVTPSRLVRDPPPQISTCGISPVLSFETGSLRLVKRQLFDFTEFNKNLSKIAIAGGRDARPENWPWMGLIFMVQDKERKNPICGASLISNQQLLTAAHCFIGRNISELVIRLGEYDLKNRNSRRILELKIKRLIQHEAFQYPALYNDVAIIQLSAKVTFSNNIATVCLPDDLKKENFVGKNATVTGWGLLQFGGKQASTLQELELPIISNGDCQKKYDTLSGAKVNLPQGISKTMLCAGYEKEVKDSCQGDSGGPLVYRMSSGSWAQIGIVSAGFECGSGIPGLYTRVTEYLNWIKEKLK